MKRIILILFAIGITAMSSVSMAAMSNSRVRKETRFLTDKMAYELNLNTAQYNDVYEINFDFIYSIRYLMDDVIRLALGIERCAVSTFSASRLFLSSDLCKWWRMEFPCLHYLYQS